jgi:AcrR family transcriptional regulator
MYETFENLPQAKRDHILQVCIEEFAKNGYDKTSTNTIVKRLGISKGVLFLYFKSKENLFLYIAEYLTETLVSDFFERFSCQEMGETFDIFDYLVEYDRILLQENPYIAVFMLEVFLNTPTALKEKIDAKHNEAHDQMLNRIDMKKFRKDIDLQQVVDLTHMVSYQIGRMIFEDIGRDIDKYRDNVDKYIIAYNQYIDIIKHGIYV